MCTMLALQLDAADEREKRLSKQVSQLLEQTGQVIQSKFETFHVSKEAKQENSLGPSLPLSALSDVETFDDEQFVQALEKITEEIKS